MYLEYTVGYIEGSCSKCEVSMSKAKNTASHDSSLMYQARRAKEYGTHMARLWTRPRQVEKQ